ncbi:MAG: hypothetical protein FRX49_13597 [Trebouxia sp. A1-2]|nr:MAG: hypothetical protein FRX49_13597 [Trebouxia sp. A1-2]
MARGDIRTEDQSIREHDLLVDHKRDQRQDQRDNSKRTALQATMSVLSDKDPLGMLLKDGGEVLQKIASGLKPSTGCEKSILAMVSVLDAAGITASDFLSPTLAHLTTTCKLYAGTLISKALQELLQKSSREQLNTAAVAQSHIQNNAASELWDIDDGASEGDCIGNRKRIQPVRYAAKKTAYVDQEPVHSDEEALSDEQTGYYQKSKASLQTDPKPFEPYLLEANGTAQAVKQAAPAIKEAKSKKLKHSQPGEQPGLQPQKTARQASVSKPKALKLPRFFKLLNTQQAASAAHQQVPTTDPQAMTGHVAVTCNIFDQLDNTKKPSIQTLQDAATSTLNDLAAQHELEKKLYVDAKKPPAKSTASNSQPFTMANAFTSMWNDIEQSRPPDCHQHLLANQDKKKKSNKQKTARFKRSNHKADDNLMTEVETRQRCETQTLEDYEKFCLDASVTLVRRNTSVVP